jgi:hypothetical protein
MMIAARQGAATLTTSVTALIALLILQVEMIVIVKLWQRADASPLSVSIFN